MKPEEAFGLVLRDLRNAKNISQEKLALEGDLDRTFISLLERGLRQPSLTTIIQISDALEIKPDELMALVAKKLSENGEKS
ncbi:MAG: helix-turn-helix domain-containing protein [Mastigocoleus sp.]